MRKLGWSVSLFVVVVGALVVAMIGGRAPRPVIEPAAPQRIAGSGSPESVVRGPRERYTAGDKASPAGPPRRPGSLRGTDADGDLVVDESGRFLVTSDALEFFDYYFVARGEESDEEIVARIEAEIDRRLDPPASDAALALLRRYLDYRHRAEALAVGDGSGGSLTEAFEAVVELRRSAFGSDADALFGADETRTRMALAQREIARDPELSPAERAALIEALYEELPEAERAARERATAPARLLAQEADLRSLGAGPADLDAHRRDTFGDAAADRLAELDRTRAAWSRRVEVYEERRDVIVAAPDLSDRERSDALRALLEENFEGPDRLRMEALERIAEQEAAS